MDNLVYLLKLIIVISTYSFAEPCPEIFPRVLTDNQQLHHNSGHIVTLLTSSAYPYPRIDARRL